MSCSRYGSAFAMFWLLTSFCQLFAGYCNSYLTTRPLPTGFIPFRPSGPGRTSSDIISDVDRTDRFVSVHEV